MELLREKGGEGISPSRLVLKHGTPERRNAGTPQRRNAGMPECRNTETRNTKLLKPGTYEK